MKISTKTIASLLLVTSVAAALPGVSKIPGGRRHKHESQFDRLLQRHDRKGELRAELLGISPLELRSLQKSLTFDEISRRHGFKNARTFRIALLGRLKNELRQRGWTSQKIEQYMLTRSARLG